MLVGSTTKMSSIGGKPTLRKVVGSPIGGSQGNGYGCWFGEIPK